ncbi:SRPBCC family protein [Agromyces mediolanus]|uniref:SRPBCC family protein n=1 Tax=Agromyces mediolanus TaxID=41986 RepID=UPI002040368E|nr:SRPBCC family protein [Agromyces mediolanus]MCM3657798.1 SRPBCC family protein [Agromyces mediolanus]
MSTPTPTGRILATDTGLDLVVTRTLPGSIDDAWASITAPERTARWMGRWEGDAAPGKTVRLQLGFEADAPWSEVRIVACERPRLLHLVLLTAGAPWEVEVELTPAGERCELRFVHRAISADEAAGVGPGWEWYLDQLSASMHDQPLPAFEEYFPAQREYYEQQLP